MSLPLRNSRISLPQGQIFWREVGHGPVLVFLHGSWNDSSQWVSVIEHLSEEYHCLAPDLLGFGESERPKVHYSIDLEVECLAEFLEALNFREVYLIAHSLGGWVAVSYALKYLDQVRGLVLVAPEGVSAEGSRGKKWWLRGLMRLPPVFFRGLRFLYPFAKRLGKCQKIDQALQLQQQLSQSPAACQLLFKRRRAEIQAELCTERLGWLKVPVLILQGGQDAPMVRSCSQTYANLTPTAQLRSIDYGGNDLPQQLPDVVAQHIQDFVNNLELLG